VLNKEEAKSEERTPREIRVFLFLIQKRAVSRKNLHFSPSLFFERGASNKHTHTHTHARARSFLLSESLSLSLSLSLSVFHLVFSSFSQK
jgi:hypothetical protein